MRKQISDLLGKEENKKIFSNFVSLFFLQGVSLLLPLITFPYLVRVLGIEKYGLVFFAQAFIAYFSTLTEYGFNLTGTREISLHKNDSNKLIKIYNSILGARLMLVSLGFVIMSIVVLSFEKFSIDWKLYFLTYGVVVGTALFPTWFFQGMEKMKFITILTVISKTIFTVLIFVLVKSSEDYLWVPSLYSIGNIFVGIISLIIINKQFDIPFRLQKANSVFQQLKNGWYVFISNVSINLYSATTTFVLGLVTNASMVGYYAIAVKMIKIIATLFAPLNQSVYPHIVQLTKKSPKEAASFVRKIMKYTIIISIGILLIGIFFTRPLFYLVFGHDVEHSILLFRLLSPLIIILPIASILFNIALLSFKMDTHFFKIYRTGAILNVILLGLLLFVVKLSTIGAGISLLICETTLTVYAGILLYKSGIYVFPFFMKNKIINHQ
ncbi:PST family polysaccharide transporter [Saonia flava]|uniref:PST family polysaccharide transporter n=1 Tax=Saonia flava TaxID=523696 RepID=A0A846R7A4_9FLAO|nr:flippase [Saonia flava]NJB72649.1 PST family polysaccharide transporter [Saonia flava]